tara:strand:- start:2077 stop:2835 length:759 start_codon:yes stop_codon:yes gene_type:complete
MNNKRLFVISCYFDGSNEAIFNCTNSILKLYENPNIVIVDSDSPDKTYFNKIRSNNVEILDVKNKNYDTGAYWIAFNKFNDFDNYYFLQDSTIIKENLSSFESNDLTTFRYFLSIDDIGGFIYEKPSLKNFKLISKLFSKRIKKYPIYGFDSQKQSEWAKEQLEKTSYFFPKSWVSVFGPMFICKKIVMDKLKNKNFDKILPINKLEQMGMERLFGIAFQQEGLNSCNAVQGENYNTDFETENFEKIFFKRK